MPGAILNVGSIAGVQPLPGQATYSATKAFVNTFSEALHAELRPHGVSCTALMPGPVVTEFDTVAGMEDMADRLPAPAWLSAEEVARQGVAAMRRGRRTVTPGAANRAISTATRHLPRGVLLPLMARRGSGRMARPRPQVS